jgi:hypothetical protein
VSAPASTSRAVVNRRPTSNVATSLNGEASTSAAAASAGANNLPVTDSPAQPKRQGRPPVTAK